MLQRHLLILQRFSGFAFDVLIAANAVNATLSRQDPVNVVERLHTNYPAFVGRMNVVRKRSCGYSWPRNVIENVVETSRPASVVRGGLFRLGLTSGDLDSKWWYDFLTDHPCISLGEDSPPRVDYDLVH